MTIKQKFDSIDQSKLNSDQKDFLGKIEKATKSFTSDNKEVNDKIEGALDKMIATFKAKMPEAIKSEAKKEVVEKKSPKAKAEKKETQTKEPKRTVMTVAKEIRKDGESWADAQSRAKSEMNKDKQSANKEVKTEMQKLMAFIKTRKELQGITNTDIPRDSVRQAKPRGKRISKDGNVYYENRENRIDRLAPNYPKDAPLLELGGGVGGYDLAGHLGGNFNVGQNSGNLDGFSGTNYTGLVGETGTLSSGEMFARGGMLSPKERYILEIEGLSGVRKGAIEKYVSDNKLTDMEVLHITIGLGRKQINGADVAVAIGGKPNNSFSKKLLVFAKSDKAMKMYDGGAMYFDGNAYANEGMEIGIEEPIDLTDDGRVRAIKTADEGKLSLREFMGKNNESREAMAFEFGGLPAGAEQTYVNYYLGEGASQGIYKKGGTIPDNYEGKTPEQVWGLWSEKQKSHFLLDHSELLDNDRMENNLGYSRTVQKDKSYNELTNQTQRVLGAHVNSGQYAEGGDIEAFSMRMVKGNNSNPDEVLTESTNIKFAKGGSFRQKRNDYLSKIGNNEADIWDKIGANSGSEIRTNKKILKEYAELVEKMLVKEEVAKGSFDKEDYDFYTDENFHLFNEFLVWNGYYEPKMTVEEKKWRSKSFSDPNFKNYISDPSVITVSNTANKTAKNYIVNAEIKSVTFKDGSLEKTVKGSDVLNGANILEKGNVLKNDATYVSKNNIVSVELKDGSSIKPANGYWVKKSAVTVLKDNPKKEYKVMSNQAIFRKKGVGTYWYVENSKGQTINKNTSKPYRGKELTNYYFLNEGGAKAFCDKLNNEKMFLGGVFNKKKEEVVAPKVAKVDYKDKSVKDKNGNVYSVLEDLGDKLQVMDYKNLGKGIDPTTIKKSEVTILKRGGAVDGKPKKETVFEIAKRIRKDGEDWKLALKRAGVMRRN